MESISFIERGLKGERSHIYHFMLSAKQGSIWYHFDNVFDMTRPGIKQSTSYSRGERSTTEPPLLLAYNVRHGCTYDRSKTAFLYVYSNV